MHHKRVAYEMFSGVDNTNCPPKRGRHCRAQRRSGA